MLTLKEFIHKIVPRKTCASCANFAWWDGDYCCLADFKILHEAPDGYFTMDMIPVIEKGKKCKNYERGHIPIYEEEYEKFLKEIKK